MLQTKLVQQIAVSVLCPACLPLVTPALFPEEAFFYVSIHEAGVDEHGSHTWPVRADESEHSAFFEVLLPF